MINGDKIAKAHRQAASFNGDFALLCVARWNDHLFMRQALGFRKQGDKRLFQRLALRLRPEFVCAAGRQYFPRIHGDQPVKTFRFFHIGGGDQHAHLRLALTNAVDQIPKLCPGERINARGRFIKD